MSQPSGSGWSGCAARCGPFEVDLRTRELRKHGVRIKLNTQCFQVLEKLLEQPGEVVTRAELKSILWPDSVHVDFENGLDTAVAKLRQALGDTAERPVYIETLPKVGYRFKAPVSPPTAQVARILVLPFVNLSGDPAQDTRADAITDELITTLATVAPGELSVIARTTAMHYRNPRKSVAQIGRELNVDHVVEGSLRSEGAELVANVQLIRTSDEMHVWANHYQFQWPDVFDVARSAATGLAARFGVAAVLSTRHPTRDAAAYDLLLRGRQHIFRATATDLEQARKYFEEAIARDPEFALAYDALGELYVFQAFFGVIPPRQACAAGIFYATRALEIDNSLAETHALLAMYRLELDYCWPEVHRLMERARQLNPASPIVRLRYANTECLPMGRLDEAAAELKSALESDPLNETMRGWLATVLYLAGDFDQCIDHCRAILDLRSDSVAGLVTLGGALCAKGLFDDGIKVHRKAVEFSGGAPFMVGWLGLALAQAGQCDEARSLLSRFEKMESVIYVPATSRAWIYAGLGEDELALDWLERAVEERDHMMCPIRHYWFLERLRANPRFLAILRKMNFEPLVASDRTASISGAQ